MVGTAKKRLTGASSEVRISQTWNQIRITNPAFALSNHSSRKRAQHGQKQNSKLSFDIFSFRQTLAAEKESNMVTEAPTVRGQRRQLTNPGFSSIIRWKRYIFTDHEYDGEAKHVEACPLGTNPKAPRDNQPVILSLRYILIPKRFLLVRTIGFTNLFNTPFSSCFCQYQPTWFSRLPWVSTTPFGNPVVPLV